MIDYFLSAKAAEVKMNKDNPFSKVRVIVALLSVATTVGLGLLVPDPTPSGASNAIIGGFTVALMMAMASVFAMIPGPPDPRRLMRSRIFHREQQAQNEERGSAVGYTGLGHPVFTRPIPAPDDRDERS